jgi:hypothetical protein
MNRNKILRTTGLVLLVVGVAAAVGTFVVRDQVSRHRRNLFSSHAMRRLAALGYIGSLDASVDLVHLLRDFVGWERHRLLRKRARAILERMEEQLQSQPVTRPEYVG